MMYPTLTNGSKRKGFQKTKQRGFSKAHTFIICDGWRSYKEKKRVKTMLEIAVESRALQYGNTGCGVFKRGIQN